MYRRLVVVFERAETGKKLLPALHYKCRLCVAPGRSICKNGTWRASKHLNVTSPGSTYSQFSRRICYAKQATREHGRNRTGSLTDGEVGNLYAKDLPNWAELAHGLVACFVDNVLSRPWGRRWKFRFYSFAATQM